MSDEEASIEESPAEEQDYYMDGPYLVFTAAYHRRRGFCCGSGCRHCPYRDEPQTPPTDS